MSPSQPDPLGSRADIHLAGLTGVLTLGILVVLNATVFRGAGAPADIGLVISPVASYLVSVSAGFWGRRRLLKAAQPPDGLPAPKDPGEAPGTAMPGR